MTADRSVNSTPTTRKFIKIKKAGFVQVCAGIMKGCQLKIGILGRSL
jgi:hypothetical protein